MLVTTRNTLLGHVALVLALSASLPVVQAGDFHHAQRDHVNLKRIIKKRAPQFPPLAPSNTTPSDTAVAAPTTSSATETTTSIATTTSAPPTTTPGLIPNILSSIESDIVGPITSSSSDSLSITSSSTVPSTSSTTSSTSSTSTTSVQTTQTRAQVTTPAPASTSIVVAKPTVTQFATVDAASTEIPKPTGAAQVKSTTIMVLIIIASSLGGVAILWTIFRKWKLARSSKFDERLQPIDWTPTDEKDDRGVIPGLRRVTSGSSSHSGSAHGQPGNGYGPTSDHGHGRSNLQPLPEHDFTAGAAPVGGYADLQRGASPQPPPMNDSLRREPSYGTRGYDTGVPLHHQAGGGGGYGTYDYPRY